MQINFKTLRILAQIALALSLLITFYFAFKPPSPSFGSLLPWDKAQHYLCFLVLCGLAIASFEKAPLWLIAVALLGFGALIEFIQGIEFIGRDAEFADWLAELIAIATVYCSLLAAKIRQA